MGWILSTRYKRTELADIKDFAAFPELRLLERGLVARPTRPGCSGAT